MDVSQSTPLVSVVLPVYNGSAYLRESIDSILSQTYANIELIIINDGSKDKSEEICLSYKDIRIKYVFQANIGLAGTLNSGLKLCNGKYIARQDQDDISYKERFAKQVDFLEKNDSIILLGTRANIISETTAKFKAHNHATNPAVLKFDLLFNNPFVHSTIMFRKNSIEKIGYYNTEKSIYEDYEFWSRFSLVGDVANLPNILLDYRHHEKGLSKDKTYFKEDAIFNISLQNIKNLMGVDNTIYAVLVSLYHEKYSEYHEETLDELTNALCQIYDKLVYQYPNDKLILDKRLKQYIRIIENRLNMIKRLKYKKNSIQMLFLKIINKLHFTPARIKNDTNG